MYNEYSSAYQTALNMYNQLRKDNPLFVKELEVIHHYCCYISAAH